MTMLELADLEVSYGNIVAIRGVSLRVDAGEIVALIGANGAGKSTLIKAVAGLAPQMRQRPLRGRRSARRSAAEIARLGLAVVPEGDGCSAP